jgi:hypothetical protein
VQRGGKYRLTQEDQAALTYATDNGISRTNGFNYLYDLVKGSNLERGYKTYNSLHSMVVPDILHTLCSGIVENCIAATLSILYAIGAIDFNYEDNVANLDNRISSNFCSSQSLEVHHYVRFPQGASPSLSSANALKPKPKNTLEGSSMESWKKIVLLLQILCSIGTDDKIVPRQGQEWCRNFKIGHEWPILEIIVNSMTLLLDFYWIVSKGRSFNAKKIKQLTHLYMNLGAHLSLLYTIQKDLLNKLNRKKGEKKGERSLMKTASTMMIHTKQCMRIVALSFTSAFT